MKTIKIFFTKPIDQILMTVWNDIDLVYKKAFFWLIGINLLAFGFEMTNLTIHHDDLLQIFIQNNHFQMDLGRFGFSWLYYYTQGAYIMPFLQMFQGIIVMALYGIVIAYLWGLRNTLDIVLIAGVVCAFPYMAQVFQYNTSMAIYPLAYLFAALAVFFSVRGTMYHIIIGILFYLLAFSIYQSVIANAATIFLFWALSRVIIDDKGDENWWQGLLKSSGTAVITVAVGGGLYLLSISLLNINLDSYQSVDKAFDLSDGLNITLAFEQIIQGTKSFFLWPEYYMPYFLKNIHLLLIFGAGIACLWFPKLWSRKITALVLLVMAAFSPRLLQILHPQGWFHNLTLTGYAVMIAGAAMIVLRVRYAALRNGVLILVFVLLGGYLVICNWISTVNELNTMAHYSTMTQILSRARTLPEADWDGKKFVVIGEYEMPNEFPYKRNTGIATTFINTGHVQRFAKLLRDKAVFIPAGEMTPGAISYAETHPVWPHPDSVAVVDGMAVVVLSKYVEKTPH